MRRFTDEEQEECCGNCKYHKNDDGDWICNNPDSECYGCVTEYKDICDQQEERSGRWVR